MITGVILADAGSRTADGIPAPLQDYKGKPLIQRQIREMNKICREIIVVASDPTPYLKLLDSSTRIITEFPAGSGPLAGLHAACMLSRCKVIWALAGDRSNPSSKAARLMADTRLAFESDAVLPVIDGQRCIYHGIYHKNCVEAVSALLGDGETDMERLFDFIYWKEVQAGEFRDKGIPLTLVKTLNNHLKIAGAPSHL